jgi:hypothetical protein
MLGRRGRGVDEQLTLGQGGTFHGEVIPDDETGEWRTLGSADDLVEFYDPTDVFGDLADALAEAFPAVAPEGERPPPAAEAEAGAEGAAAGEPSEAEGDTEDEPSA